jgi:Fic family protein
VDNTERLAGVRALAAILGDGDFQALLRQSFREYVPWEDFLWMKLPQNLSTLEVWELLSDLRRPSAIYWPILEEDEAVGWYSPTLHIQASLTLIERLCRQDSVLHKALVASAGQQYLVQARIQESIAAAQFDGVTLAPQQAFRMLSTGRAAKGANEMLVYNTSVLMEDLGRYVDEPISPDLLIRLHEQVLAGVDVRELDTVTPRLGFLFREVEDGRLIEISERRMREICDYANGVTGDPYDHPVIRALAIREAIRMYRLLPYVSGVVARLVFSIYALKNDLPVMAVLPVSKSILEWEQSRATETRTTGLPHEGYVVKSRHLKHNEMDFTPFVTIATDLLANAVEEFNVYVEQREERDRQILELLREDALFNHRQRAIIALALRSPSSKFRIRSHQIAHNIAYATARADLLALESSGYLVREQQAKAFVFTVVPDLEAKLAR